MTYEKFLAAMTQKVQEEMGEDYKVILHHVRKNNNTMLDGLTILRVGEQASPTIYLNEYYEQFRKTGRLQAIVREIRKIYETHVLKIPFQVEEFINYDKTKAKLVFKLINREDNEDLLQEVPYQEFLDLAIVCYVLLGDTEQGRASIMVKKEHEKLWGVREEELFAQAMKNTPVLLPFELKSMEAIVNEALEIEEEAGDATEDLVPMYVLTNTSRLNGAAAILYPGLLEQFAERMQDDLYVIPSSIHEVILLPVSSDVKKQDLQNMVCEVNKDVVDDMERLSNVVYVYSRKNKHIMR